MPAMPAPDLAYLLLAACESPYGISVITNDPQALRNKLVAERKKLGLSDLLAFTQPAVSPENHVWIVRKDANAEEEN
jgi:hypothetical protein